MNEEQKIVVPTWFWVIAAVSLMWNILGCLIFSSEVFAQEAMIESMTGEQKEWVRSTPRWVYVVFAISVSTGVAGSVCLLMRKRLSVPLFTISFAAVLIQMAYTISPTGTNISLWDGWGRSNHGFGESESAPVWVPFG